jgi:hypothetical protein
MFHMILVTNSIKWLVFVKGWSMLCEVGNKLYALFIWAKGTAWLRQPEASTTDTSFSPRSLHVRFVVLKVALWQVFLPILQVPFHQCSIPIHSPTTHAIYCFSPSTSVFPCQYHSTIAPYSSSSLRYSYQKENVGEALEPLSEQWAVSSAHSYIREHWAEQDFNTVWLMCLWQCCSCSCSFSCSCRCKASCLWPLTQCHMQEDLDHISAPTITWNIALFQFCLQATPRSSCRYTNFSAL